MWGLVLGISTMVGGAAPVKGPYSADSVVLQPPPGLMDSSDTAVDVFFPTASHTRRGGGASDRSNNANALTTAAMAIFPLIVYAHGDTTAVPAVHYKPLFGERSLISRGRCLGSNYYSILLPLPPATLSP